MAEPQRSDAGGDGEPPEHRHSPWALAGLVVGALALAHAGLGLLLTKNARHAVADIESAWTPAELEQAPPPGPAPEQASAEYARWRRAQSLREDAQVHAERSHQVRLLSWSMLGSFLLQAGVVLRAAWRATRPRSLARPLARPLAGPR